MVNSVSSRCRNLALLALLATPLAYAAEPAAEDQPSNH
jgi:hypothetical protein